MANLTVNGLMAFVPAKDYQLARRFYRAMGFAETFTNDDVTGFRLEAARFLLQNFFNQEMADNFMLTLMVDDVEAWYQHLRAKLVPAFPDVKIRSPENYPWGLREVHVIDPSGVCWHIAQPIPGAG